MRNGELTGQFAEKGRGKEGAGSGKRGRGGTTDIIFAIFANRLVLYEMKNFRFLALVAMAAALISCEPPINGVHVDSTNLSFPGEGGTQTLQVKAGTAWTIEVPADLYWLNVSPKSGSASADVTVTASPNKMKDQDRNVELVINYEGNQIRVNVNQARGEGEPVFEIQPRNVQVNADGGEFSVKVVSDASDYDVEINAKWITAVSREGNRYDGETLVFQVAPNDKKEARNAVVSICTKNGTCNPVTVSQAAFEGALYEHVNVGFRYTATWCGHCPYMDETFKLVKSRRDDFDFVTIHGSNGYPMYFSDSGVLMDTYNVSGFPTGVINGWKEFSNSHNVESNATKLEKLLDEYESSFSCLAGISVNSTVADGSITVNAQVETSLSGEYLVSAFLLESGIVSAQTLFPDSGDTQELKNFVHDNVARKTLTSSVTGEAFQATAATKTSFSWTASLDKSWKEKNLSVVVLVHRPYAADVKKPSKKYPDNYIVNAAFAPAGGSFEMKYAE